MHLSSPFENYCAAEGHKARCEERYILSRTHCKSPSSRQGQTAEAADPRSSAVDLLSQIASKALSPAAMAHRRSRRLQGAKGGPASGEELLGLFLELNGQDLLGGQDRGSLALAAAKFHDIVAQQVRLGAAAAAAPDHMQTACRLTSLADSCRGKAWHAASTPHQAACPPVAALC